MRFYQIKKGNHYATVSLFEKIGAIGWKISKVSLRFVFRPECWWAPPRNNDDNDLNKLAGIGYGTNHHNNSVRLAWVPDFGQPGIINLYGYTYDEKKEGQKFSYTFIKKVHTGESVTGMIERTGDKYRITVQETTVLMDNTHPDPNLCFRLFPYFGGNNTAPCDMVIELEMN